jgi:phosphoserine phosphatase RsbU/P
MRMITAPCHIELFVGSPPLEDLRTLLAESGHDVAVRGLNETNPHAQLFIVDDSLQPIEALKLCRRLRAEQSDDFTPILFVTHHGARLAALDSGADVTLDRPFSATELIGQVQALLRFKDRHDQLAGKVAEASGISKRLHDANQQINQELELARRLQESFLPQTLPQMPRLRFAVKYKPISKVGGDFYDIFRLDEKHLAFYIADAMGHGVPASLLTIFVKKGVRAKEISGQTYRLVPPTEVLQRLNIDLIEQQIPDLPFITMIYVLFNYHDGVLQFSRAGHPYPLYLPKDGKPSLWQIEGSLLGVFETKYRLQTRELNPGDKLLLYTDGMDGASFEDHAVGLPSLLAAAERFRSLPIDELIERLTSDLFTQTRLSDDLTVFGLEMLDLA